MSVRSILDIPSLLVDSAFIDEKEQMKSYLGKAVDTIVMQNQKRTEPYFIVFHEKSDAEHSQMKISVSTVLPGFVTNQIVFWVCNRRGICEWLWTVPPRMGKENLKPEFNTSGVAFLQAKGAMPS